MKRRNFISSLLLGYSSLVLPEKARGITNSSLGALPPRPRHVIEFEALGGVGDGDPETGRGTDNAGAFARAEAMARKGYGIKFKPKSFYKTTEQINIHSMYWIGDNVFKPVIFGWFSEKGKKIIGRSGGDQQITACVIGMTFHRCGPFAEHGIVIDNLEKLYLDIDVTSIPGAQGGAIGISPFFPENRHSRNCFIKARINNGGDFGLQLGSVSGAIIDVSAVDCYREVVGIEPIVRGTIKVDSSVIINKTDIFFPGLGLSTGDPLLYYDGGESRGPIVPGRHYFVINNEDGSVSLSDTRASAIEGYKLNLQKVDGQHHFAKAAVVEDVVIRRAEIIDHQAIKPTLYANTMGYIILTGNSGGYMRNIISENIYIEGNQVYPKGKSIGIYAQGVKNLILKNIRIHGCDNAIVVSDGWLNGMFDDNGRPIRVKNGYSRLSSSNVTIIDPELIGFRNNGVVFEAESGYLHGGKLIPAANWST